ncbi:MAG: hypothetical protein HYZ13_02530 [Acidobacteria bacterium]|nr:hypothetical protein [Acidobacteriota bacterium]
MPLSPSAIDTARLPWVPLKPGLAFKPLAYLPDNAAPTTLSRVAMALSQGI